MFVKLFRVVVASILFETMTLATAVEQHAYIGKWVPNLSQCRLVDSMLLKAEGDLYLIAECDAKNTTERSIRIWRTRPKPHVPSKMLDVTIFGEVILPWQQVTGMHSVVTEKSAANPSQYSYWLVQCREITQKDRLAENAFIAAGFIRVNSKRATRTNGLLYFKEGQLGTIEVLDFSKIAECQIPEG